MALVISQNRPRTMLRWRIFSGAMDKVEETIEIAGTTDGISDPAVRKIPVAVEAGIEFKNQTARQRRR